MIRKYEKADLDTLLSIWRAASELAQPFLSKEFVARETEYLRTVYFPMARTWVAEDGGTPVGFITLIEDEIAGLFVHPDAHGRGIGRDLVDYVVGLKGTLRAEVFDRNTVGRRFYRRLGFMETGRYVHKASGELTIKLVLPSR